MTDEASTVLKPGEGSHEEASRVLGEAVRRAPLPGISGLAFEVMGLAWVVGAFVGISSLSYAMRGASRRLVEGAPGALEVTSWFDVARIVNSPPSPRALALAALASAPLVWASVRIAAGLARMASEGTARRPGAKVLTAWRLGGSTQLSALGVWLLVAGMMAAAMVVLFLPLTLSSRVASGVSAFVPVHVVLSGLGVAFAAAYGAGLGAVQELAMASLVRHERGVGSAVLHAWRLVRSRRASSHRMALVEAGSRVAVVAAALGLAASVGPVAGAVALVGLGALCGSVRCQAWGMVYRRVGGI